LDGEISAESSDNSSTSASTKTIYVVKSGDTLSGISSKNNISIKKIKKLNNLKSDNIKAGQKLRIN